MNNYQNVVEACNLCIEACNRCITESYKRSDILKRFEMVRKLRDCIDTCMLALSVLNRKSPFVDEVSNVCAHICQACAEACAPYQDSSTMECAAKCRQAAEACRELIAA